MAKKAATANAVAAEPIDEVEASRAPLMEHLIELRNRMTHSLIVVGVLFCAAWFVTDTVLNYLLTPLGDAAHRAGRPLDELFVAQTTAPLEMLFVKLKLAFAIISISGVHALKTYLSGDLSLENIQIVAVVAVIHFTFVLSAIGISFAERLTRDQH